MNPNLDDLRSYDPFLTKVEDGVKAVLKKARTLNPSSAQMTSVGQNCCKVLVAYSGGPDSTALLRSLLELKSRFNFEISACHVNHKTRGSESDADEAYCRSIAASWNIPILVRENQECGANTEEVLRNIRYAHLSDAANEINASFIATGHTQDDQIETLLFRLFRGAATFGLLCMDSARLLGCSTILARPLLAISRSECVDFLKQREIEAREDSSNEDTQYSRNYLRKEVIPLIASRFPGFQMRLDRLRQLVEADEDYFFETTKASISEIITSTNTFSEAWDFSKLKRIPLPLLRRAFAQGLRARGIEVCFSRIENLCLLVVRQKTGTVCLSNDWQVRLADASLVWEQRPDSSALARPVMDLNLKIPGTTICPQISKAFKAESFEAETSLEFPAATANQALVDLSAINGSLRIRNRKPGDVIRPFGMQKLVKLKKYIHTHKPADWAPTGPTIVIADNDEVLWVPGVGLSEKLRVTESPSHKLSILDLASDEMTFC